MKIKATIGHPKGDFHYFTGTGGQITDKSGDKVGSYHYVSGSDMRKSIQDKNGIYETWIVSTIAGRLNDGRAIKGKVRHLPGFIGNSDVGEIEISDARSRPTKKSFKRSADLMVWKKDGEHKYEFTVLVRPIGQTGWSLYQGSVPFSSRATNVKPIADTGKRFTAFNESPDWGTRVAISQLPRTDLLFFKALLAAKK